MANGDYGYFGKGDTGYAQYMTAFNRNFGGSSGAGRPQHHAELALLNLEIDMIGRVNNGVARWVVLADIFKRDVAHAIHLLSSILHPYYTGRR